MSGLSSILTAAQKRKAVVRAALPVDGDRELASQGWWSATGDVPSKPIHAIYYILSGPMIHHIQSLHLLV
jgi:hypothetical protein